MPNYFLISFISNVFQIINILIIIRVLLSWFNYNAQNQYIRLLYKTTEPILSPIRNLLSSFNMGIDISPLIAIFALSLIRNFLIRLFVQIQFNQIIQPNSNPVPYENHIQPIYKINNLKNTAHLQHTFNILHHEIVYC